MGHASPLVPDFTPAAELTCVDDHGDAYHLSQASNTTTAMREFDVVGCAQVARL